ncbi:TVP38/TMEM64 family protein [Amphibacillus sediminis]|uniref:TVP38/TMEM64 family protein n=1 Tax=Amphibacillus sediminis TaxID=360185 RepID=UPI00083153B0|nr:VTT domain-containing protein [Amphibacillus sediminis]
MNGKLGKLSKTQKRAITLSVLGIVLIIAITLLFLPYYKRLYMPEFQDKIKEWINSLGVGGWLIVFGIQVLQIVIAFIPGEPIEVIAGILYGTWGGLLLCLSGCVVASTFIFLISKKFGMPLLYKIFRKDKVENFAFMKDKKRVETVSFILFLIPGTPKDMLTYIVGVSNLKLRSFLLISTFARIPSVVSSTMIGSSIQQGDWTITITIFIITAMIGILGIWFHDHIIDFYQNSRHKDPE